MSSLNLQPSLPIILVQAGVFLANMYAVKKLMLEPYLKVYEKRQSMTTGAAEAAKNLSQANDEAMAKIAACLNTASSEAQERQDGILRQAAHDKERLLGEAEAQARAELSAAQSQLRRDLEEQRLKIPLIIAALSDEAFNQVIA